LVTRGNENLQQYPDWQRIQRYVLAVFYYSTNGNEWADNAGWLSNGGECLWASHFLDKKCDESGRLLELVIVNNNLDGTIPLDLALLSNDLCKLVRLVPFAFGLVSGS
jgi:hypothetical protein